MEIGQFAALKVIRTRLNSVLLDWGQDEPLSLPQSEQRWDLSKGDRVVVFITEDDRVFSRPMATMYFDEEFDPKTSALEAGQKVELLVFGNSEMGLDCIIDGKFRGLLFHDQVFGDVRYGDSLTAYVKNVRPDGKVDLMAQPQGTRGTTDLGWVILKELESRGGFLALTDKSAPEEIYEIFGVSKKKYKMAVGRLYKHRDVILEEDGVRLNPESTRLRQ